MAGSYKLKSDPPKTPPASAPPAARPAPPPNPAAGTPAKPTKPVAVGEPVPLPVATARLTSLDAYRGFIMILLAASGFGIARLATLPEDAPVWNRPVAAAEGPQTPTAEQIAARRSWWKTLAFQFEHPPWRSDFLPFHAENSLQKSEWLRVGVAFWDLIQPAFMFMVGVAMPFSYRRRTATGESRFTRLWHALARAVILVLLGVFLYTKTGERTGWGFTNVLAQIGLGYFFVYLLLGFRWQVQAAACVVILGGYWYFLQSGYWQMTGQPQPTGEYDVAAVKVDPAKGEVYTGKFAPWSKNHNAAHAVDLKLLNTLADPNGQALDAWRTKLAAGPLTFGEKLQLAVRRIFFANDKGFEFNAGGYQTLNFVPSMATMLLGAMCGGLLMSGAPPGRKLLTLLVIAIVCLALGRVTGNYLCPIVKRIWTPSWALFSGGYVVAMLAVFYLLFDILPFKKLAFPLVVVGMNSMVMYMLGQLAAGFTRERIVRPHLTGLYETILGTDAVRDGEFYLLSDQMFGRLIEPLGVLFVFWLIVYWLYRQKIFVRI
jgi:predicted acyltransferase